MAVHVVRDTCIRVLNVSSISKSFTFWIYCIYFVSLGPGGVKLLPLITAKTQRVYVEPVSMCMSKDGNSVYDWIDVLVGLGSICGD